MFSQFLKKKQEDLRPILLFNSTDIADETRDFPCIPVLIGDSKSALPVFLIHPG